MILCNLSALVMITNIINLIVVNVDCKLLVYLATKSFKVGLYKFHECIYHWFKRG